MESRAQRAEGVAKDNEATHHRVFTLKLRENEEGRPLRFVTFGCQGSGKASQHDVASLLNRRATMTKIAKTKQKHNSSMKVAFLASCIKWHIH